MPSRHIVKEYAPDSYYHIYSQGVYSQALFRDQADYDAFLDLLRRYLLPTIQKDKSGRPYPNYSSDIQLLAFCLMGNHFHLLVHQNEKRAIIAFMRSLLASYTVYFNTRHQRRGSLFQSHYHASLVGDEAYLPHITRYIHLSPGDFRTHRYSSYGYYTGQKEGQWIHPDAVLQLVGGARHYPQFVSNFDNYKQTLDLIKPHLAI